MSVLIIVGVLAMATGCVALALRSARINHLIKVGLDPELEDPGDYDSGQDTDYALPQLVMMAAALCGFAFLDGGSGAAWRIGLGILAFLLAPLVASAIVRLSLERDVYTRFAEKAMSFGAAVLSIPAYDLLTW